MLDSSEWSIIESSHHPPHNSKVLPFFLFQALGRRGGPGAVSNPRQQSIDMRKEGLEWRKNGKKKFSLREKKSISTFFRHNHDLYVCKISRITLGPSQAISCLGFLRKVEPFACCQCKFEFYNSMPVQRSL